MLLQNWSPAKRRRIKETFLSFCDIVLNYTQYSSSQAAVSVYLHKTNLKKGKSCIWKFMHYLQNDRGYGSSYSPVDSGGSNEDATTSDAAGNDEDQMSGSNEAMAGENFL